MKIKSTSAHNAQFNLKRITLNTASLLLFVIISISFLFRLNKTTTKCNNSTNKKSNQLRNFRWANVWLLMHVPIRVDCESLSRSLILPSPIACFCLCYDMSGDWKISLNLNQIDSPITCCNNNNKNEIESCFMIVFLLYRCFHLSHNSIWFFSVGSFTSFIDFNRHVVVSNTLQSHWSWSLFPLQRNRQRFVSVPMQITMLTFFFSFNSIYSLANNFIKVNINT